MGTMRILEGVPEDALPLICDAMNAASHLIPAWCQEIVIGWDAEPEDPENTASCCAQHAYRQAWINFHPGFTAEHETDESRARIVRHEIMHIALGPLSEFGQRLIASMPARQREVFVGLWTDAEEAVVSDLSYLTAPKGMHEALAAEHLQRAAEWQRIGAADPNQSEPE